MAGRRDWIGLRVGRWRTIAGMTQQELADRAQVSREYISRIENGRTAVTDRRILYALAHVLGVQVGDLTDQPTQPRSRHDLAVYSAVPLLRGALDDDPADHDPIDIGGLRGRVDRAMAARMACDYTTLAELMPQTITDTRRLANSGGMTEPDGLRLFVRAAVCAALAVKPFGYVDLSARLSERASLAASMLGHAVERAAAAFAAAQCALASGTAGGQHRSLATAVSAAEQIGDFGDDEALTWYTMLHLHAALSAAAVGKPDAAVAHHEEAATTAARVRSDPWRMEPTPANVGVWRVSIALDNNEPDRAPQYGRRVDRHRLRTQQRRSHLLINIGRGHYAAGDQDRAVHSFLEADEVAPSELRNRPSVREVVGQMVRSAKRQGSPELRELATRMGIDPLDPEESPSALLM